MRIIVLHYHSRCRGSFNSRRDECIRAAFFSIISQFLRYSPRCAIPRVDGEYFREIKTIAAGDEIQPARDTHRNKELGGIMAARIPAAILRFIFRPQRGRLPVDGRDSFVDGNPFGIQLSDGNRADMPSPSPVDILRRPCVRIPLSLWDPVSVPYLFPGLRNWCCAGITPPLEDLNKISWWVKATDIVYLNLSSFVREFAARTSRA